MKAKGQICSQILERHRKIVSLESDSSTLAQVQFTPSAGAYMCVQALGCETLFCTKLLGKEDPHYLVKICLSLFVEKVIFRILGTSYL